MRFARGSSAAAGVAGLLLLAACGESSTSQSLSSVMLPSPPSGYTQQSVSGGDGDLGIDDASSATPADPGAVRAFLQSVSWRGAQIRVWVQGSSYAEDIGYAFASTADAGRFQGLEVGALKQVSTDYVYSMAPQVPGGEGFILYSQTRVGGRNVFCNGAWVLVGTDVFELLTCGATPQDGSLATALAVQQLQRAGGSPGPSPT